MPSREVTRSAGVTRMFPAGPGAPDLGRAGLPSPPARGVGITGDHPERRAPILMGPALAGVRTSRLAATGAPGASRS